MSAQMEPRSALEADSHSLYRSIGPLIHGSPEALEAPTPPICLSHRSIEEDAATRTSRRTSSSNPARLVSRHTLPAIAPAASNTMRQPARSFAPISVESETASKGESNPQSISTNAGKNKHSPSQASVLRPHITTNTRFFLLWAELPCPPGPSGEPPVHRSTRTPQGGMINPDMASRMHLLAPLSLCLALAMSPSLGLLPEEASTGELTSMPGWMGPNTEGSITPSLQYREPHLDMRRVVQLSVENPRAYLYKGFLSDDECDHLIAKASAKLQRSKVMANASSGGHVSEVRTSSGAFLPKGSDDVIKSIEKRIEEWTFLPIANQEPQQVLRYTEGQKYVAHHDYFPDPPENLPGGQRYATVLMYLNNVTKGGETVFSAVKDETPKDDTWSDCAKGLLAVKPEKGDALLFFSMHPDGTPDPNSLHYACPVVEGVKWSAPKWIRMRDFGLPAHNPNVCEDANAQCERWASVGECKKNPTYMLATCRLACGVCTANKTS